MKNQKFSKPVRSLILLIFIAFLLTFNASAQPHNNELEGYDAEYNFETVLIDDRDAPAGRTDILLSDDCMYYIFSARGSDDKNFSVQNFLHLKMESIPAVININEEKSVPVASQLIPEISDLDSFLPRYLLAQLDDIYLLEMSSALFFGKTFRYTEFFVNGRCYRSKLRTSYATYCFRFGKNGELTDVDKKNGHRQTGVFYSRSHSIADYSGFAIKKMDKQCF
jgi:hypothetical protein